MTVQGDVEAMCIKVPIFILPFYANFCMLYTFRHLEIGMTYDRLRCKSRREQALSRTASPQPNSL